MIVEEENKPWLKEKKWASAIIEPNHQTHMRDFWGLALYINAMLLPINYFIVPIIRDHQTEFFYYLLLLLPLTGLILIAIAIKKTLLWRRFKGVQLQLDPYPASIGGHLGGSMELPLSHSANNFYEINVVCKNHDVSYSNEGNTVKTKTVWSTTGFAFTNATNTGSRLEFLFQLDDKLPQSETPEQNPFHTWHIYIHCNIGPSKYSLEFDIPVFPTQQKAQCLNKLSAEHPRSGEYLDKTLSELLSTKDTDIGFQLQLPAFRYFLHTAISIAIGIASIAFAIYVIDTEIEDFYWILKVIMAAAGIHMVFNGVYDFLTSKVIHITKNGISILALLFGVPIYRRNIDKNNIHSFSVDGSKGLAFGRKNTAYYSLKVQTKNKKSITLIKYLPGHALAVRAASLLQEKIDGLN